MAKRRLRNHFFRMSVELLEPRTLLAFAAADPFLEASGTLIRDTHGTGNVVELRGTNLGNWLYMEPWMGTTDSSGAITSNADSENQIWNLLTSRFGATTADSLINTYENNYITTTDLNNIQALGMNMVRVPFSWRTIENADGSVRSDAFTQMDWLVSNAAQRGIYVIFDLHDLPGPAESSAFWTNTAAQTQVVNLWKTVAQHYAGNADVAGFDIMNEPQDVPSTQAVWTLHDQIYAGIRSVDPTHIIMMEGTFGSWDWDMLPSPASQGWSDVVYEMHEYQYNSSDSTVQAGAANQVAMFQSHTAWNVPGYIGEFNDFNYTDAWTYSVEQFAKAGLSFSDWSYKSAAGDSYGGDIYNSWGIYNDSANLTPPALSTDSATTIRQKWAAFNTNSGAFVINPALAGPMELTSLNPQVASSATATTGSIAGTAILSTLGTDPIFAESSLTYNWSLTSTLPAGLTVPSFSVNGTNIAKSSIATFANTGTYNFRVTITDPNGFTVTSLVSYVVSLPGWLGTGSIAAWNPSSSVLNVTGNTSINADPGNSQPIIVASGAAASVSFNPTSSLLIHLGGLALTNGAVASVLSLGTSRSHTNHRALIIGSNSTSSSPVFIIDSLSKLDLLDNDLIVHSGNLQNITGLLTSGYASTTNKVWSGNGIISSIAAGSNLTTLGIISSAGPETFDGETIQAGDVLVKYTLYGDTDLTGFVDGTDYSRLDVGYLSHLTGWQNGDFNYDGQIDGTDYTLIDNTFNTQAAAPLATVATSMAVESKARYVGQSILSVVPPQPLTERKHVADASIWSTIESDQLESYL